MKPLDSVLFVCRLNTITIENDLELILSQFGSVYGYEIIRDKDSSSL